MARAISHNTSRAPALDPLIPPGARAAHLVLPVGVVGPLLVLILLIGGVEARRALSNVIPRLVDAVQALESAEAQKRVLPVLSIQSALLLHIPHSLNKRRP